MTDKVQKIREEVEMVVNRRLNLLNGDYFDLNEETNGFTNEIMDIIDSLQKEPVSKEIGDYDHKAVTESLHPELKEEPVSEELEEAAFDYAEACKYDGGEKLLCVEHFKAGANWQKEKVMANTADATIGLPYENKDGGYTHLVDVSRPLPVGDNKIAIIFKED